MEQLGEIIAKLTEALTSLGLPMDQITEFFGGLMSKIAEILGPIIGGIGG